MIHLCPIGGALLDAPTGRGKEELLDHVEQCEICARELESSPHSAQIYRELAWFEDAVPQEEQARLDRLLAAPAADAESVEQAIADVLIPSLPPALQNIRELGPEVTPRHVFLAAEAVAMAVYRAVRQNGIPASAELEMDGSGSVRRKAVELVPASVLRGEISEVAAVSPDTAAHLLIWLRRAARSHPTLFVGMDSIPEGLDRVRFSLTGRNPDEELAVRWCPAVAVFDI